MQKKNNIYILWTHILTYMKIKQFKILYIKIYLLFCSRSLFFQQYKTHSQDTLQVNTHENTKQAQDGVCTAKRNNLKKKTQSGNKLFAI